MLLIIYYLYKVFILRLCSKEWTVLEDTLNITLLCVALLSGAISVWGLNKLADFLNIMNLSKRIFRKTVVHSSLIEELINSRKNSFVDFMEAQKKAGQTSLEEITSQMEEAPSQYRRKGSLLEKIFFSYSAKYDIDDNYINAPDRNGDYHIIRLVVNSNIQYTYTNNNTIYLKKIK